MAAPAASLPIPTDITPVMFAASLLVGAWDKGYDTCLLRLQSEWRQRAQEE